VWHLYVIRVEERDRVLAELTADGIGVGIHYPTPVHLTEAYADLGYRRGQFPVAEAAADRILSLPMFPHLLEEQQERVAAAVSAAMSRALVPVA
jgi:dTDP-4-amino-4,6-dideoxygalactose transaminase